MLGLLDVPIRANVIVGTGFSPSLSTLPERGGRAEARPNRGPGRCFGEVPHAHAA